ncbi:MAG: hypothetical protein AAF685_04745 [Cyanobacteria bacterium P01_C01_bin.89]
MLLPLMLGSAEEPLSSGIQLDRAQTRFRKFRLRYAKGASGQIRVMYLVLLDLRAILLS